MGNLTDSGKTPWSRTETRVVPNYVKSDRNGVLSCIFAESRADPDSVTFTYTGVNPKYLDLERGSDPVW